LKCRLKLPALVLRSTLLRARSPTAGGDELADHHGGQPWRAHPFRNRGTRGSIVHEFQLAGLNTDLVAAGATTNPDLAAAILPILRTTTSTSHPRPAQPGRCGAVRITTPPQSVGERRRLAERFQREGRSPLTFGTPRRGPSALLRLGSRHDRVREAFTSVKADVGVPPDHYRGLKEVGAL
jgi:hypothetical protein